MVLSDPEVARRHLKLVLRSGRAYVEDLAGGVRVNGQPLKGTRELLPGDVLKVGQTELTFAHEAPQTMLEVEVVKPPAVAGKVPLAEQDTRLLEQGPEPILPPFSPKAAKPKSEPPRPKLRPVRDEEVEDTAMLEPTGASLPPRPRGEGRPPAEARAKPSPTEHLTGETRLIEVVPSPGRPQPPVALTGETRLLDVAPVRSASGIVNPPPALAGETRLIELAPFSGSAALRVPDDESTDPSGVPARGVPAPVSPPTPERGALDRSRLRREAQESLGGLLRLTWAELSPRARQISLGVSGALALLLVTALVLVFMPEGKKVERPLGPEPEVLTNIPPPDSFGVGEGVDWEHVDQKAFTFEVISPTRIAAVLHYRAEYLSEGELALSLNGVDQGFAPADTANARTRDISLVISPGLVRRGESNTLLFDSVKNPPAEDPWKISHVWVELLPVPELAPAKLLELAKEHARVAAESDETRAVSSGNLFRAWKSYRDAWLSLEGLDTQLNPELYQHVRFQLGTLGAELDRNCSRLSREFERAMTLNQRKQARRVVEELERVFPSNEHRCHNLARERRAELEL